MYGQYCFRRLWHKLLHITDIFQITTKVYHDTVTLYSQERSNFHTDIML